MHGDISAVTMKSNKIVLNEIKDNEVLLEPSPGGKNGLFGQPNIFKSGIAGKDPHFKADGKAP